MSKNKKEGIFLVEMLSAAIFVLGDKQLNNIVMV